MEFDMSFAVNLGGGLYMDSNGILHETKPANVPVYDAPFSLPVDPKKVKDALEGAKNFLADADDPKNTKKFTDLGVPLELFDLLSGIGKVAGIIAPYIAAIAIAYDCLRIFGVIKSSSGPSALEQLVEQRYQNIKAHIIGLATIIEQQHLEEAKNDVLQLGNKVETYNKTLKNSNPDIHLLELLYNQVVALHDNKVSAVIKLLDVISYMGLFNHSEHTRVWPYIQNILFTHPPKTNSPAAAKIPGEGSVRFDHRLMIPLAAYAAELYLACIKGITPEYRTTGDYHTTLRSMALQLDLLAENMLIGSLAHTIYKPTDFSTVMLRPWEVNQSLFIADEDVHILPNCNRFPVGAMDLRYHNDAFFGPFLDGLISNEQMGLPHDVKYGSMNFRWIPPARLKKFDRGTQTDPIVYIITNPEECAAAANEQSKKDYADLLLTSGYSNLLHLAALYRNEMTEPAKSQTVTADTHFLRRPLAISDVTVKSEPIFMTGIIQSPARRQQQLCTSNTYGLTQSVKRVNPIQYKIKLRTINCLTQVSLNPLVQKWHEPDYDKFQWIQYDKDIQDPAFLKMSVYNSIGQQVDEHLLAEGSSPREPKHSTSTIEMKAHTFDWWIPIHPPFSLEVDPEKTFARLRSIGWTGPAKKDTVLAENDHNLLSTAYDISGNSGPVFNLGGSSLLINGKQNWTGEHREVAEKNIKMECDFSWNADKLQVSLKGRPEDRNYIVYLVIEEMLPLSSQVLHTAFPIPVNGQLTYVPQKFFDEETAAKKKLEKALSDFNKKYAKSAAAGPDDPIIGWLRPGDMQTAEKLEQVAQLAATHQPDLFKKVLLAHGIKLPGIIQHPAPH